MVKILFKGVRYRKLPANFPMGFGDAGLELSLLKPPWGVVYLVDKRVGEYWIQMHRWDSITFHLEVKTKAIRRVLSLD